MLALKYIVLNILFPVGELIYKVEGVLSEPFSFRYGWLHFRVSFACQSPRTVLWLELEQKILTFFPPSFSLRSYTIYSKTLWQGILPWRTWKILWSIFLKCSIF